MSISSRIHDTIENWQVEWKDRLRGWFAHVAENAIERTFDYFEPDLRAEVTTSMNRLKEIPGLPDDIRSILDKATEEPKAVQLIAIIPYLIAFMMGTAMGAARPIANWASYPIERLTHSFRLDPGSVITAWRRNKAEYEKLFDDLRDQGWNEDRIEALKFFTLYMPSAAEIVHWYAREVYEPDMIDRYGLDSELPVYEETDFPKIGVDSTQAKHHWMAHWEHASYMQIIEMLHRGVLSLDKTMPASPTTKGGWATRDTEGTKAMYDWYRLVEIPPFWRDRLTEMSWNVPTRVDVRRWWDMRTISEDELYNIYHRQGYHGKDLDNYVLWTKVYVAFPDLIARFKNGWISEDSVRSQLIAMGMSQERVEEMWQTKFKPEAPARVVEELHLTKAEIVKGVKKEAISWQDGIELLMDLGLSEWEADFKLTIDVGAMEGSPETYPEFKDITQKYRLAMGLQSIEVPTDVIEASKAVRDAAIALRSAESQNLTNAELAPYLKALSDAEYRYRALLVKWEAAKKKKAS